MSWNMSFEYDAQHDLVHARFTRCLLVSAADVERWKAEVAEHLAGFGRKVDLLLDLDGLEVTFTAGRLFGQARRELLERFTQRASCYGGDEMTRMFLSTSGVLHGRPVPQLDSREAALHALLADRETARQRAFSPFAGVPQLDAVGS